MDYGNVAQVTNLSSSAIYFQKFGRSPEESNSLYLPQLHAFSEVWSKLDENCGNTSLLKILTSEILQSPPNDSQRNSKDQT